MSVWKPADQPVQEIWDEPANPTKHYEKPGDEIGTRQFSPNRDQLKLNGSPTS